MRSSLRGSFVAAAVLLCSLLTAPSANASITVDGKARAARASNVTVFDLVGVDATPLRRATVVWGARRSRKSIPVSTVRRAVARGSLQVRLPRTGRKSRDVRYASLLVLGMRTRQPTRRPRKSAPAAAPIATPTPTPTPISTPTPLITSGAGLMPQTAWRAAGAAPLADGAAAARVRPAVEQRPANAVQNAYRPTPMELESFRHGQKDRYGRDAVAYSAHAALVTGGFSGTTDEIFQWAAHKWGIPEDVVRAVAVNESSWKMSTLGDRTTVSDPMRYPAYSRIAGTNDVMQSLGLMQVRWSAEGLHVGTEPLRWKSSAFNVDYWASIVRYYYDGLCDWCGNGYAAGQSWASVGAWYSGQWDSADGQAYIDAAKRNAESRPWTNAGF